MTLLFYIFCMFSDKTRLAVCCHGFGPPVLVDLYCSMYSGHIWYHSSGTDVIWSQDTIAEDILRLYLHETMLNIGVSLTLLRLMIPVLGRFCMLCNHTHSVRYTLSWSSNILHRIITIDNPYINHHNDIRRLWHHHIVIMYQDAIWVTLTWLFDVMGTTQVISIKPELCRVVHPEIGYYTVYLELCNIFVNYWSCMVTRKQNSVDWKHFVYWFIWSKVISKVTTIIFKPSWIQGTTRCFSNCY